MSMESRKPTLSINKLLLTNLLKFAGLSQQQCSLTLSHHHNSLVGYIYRYDKKIYPRSFSYFFLLSIYRALAKKHNAKEKISRFDLFYNMILEHGGVIEKILIPALEHHILSISSLNRGVKIGFGENITKNKEDIFDKDEIEIIDKYISIIESEKYENYKISLRGYDCADNLSDNDKDEIGDKDLTEIKNFEIEINAIKNFYVICESLRKIFLPNFYSPSDYKKINFLNNKDSGFLMKKSAIRKNFKINNFSNLFFFKANDNYMHPTISLGDDCLAIKISPKDKSIFDGGLFIIRELKGICIRRLQFSVFKDTYQIISIPDNKDYSRQTFPAVDNEGKSRIIGKIIWRSGFTTTKEIEEDFQIPEFLRGDKIPEPNLFSDQPHQSENDLNQKDIAYINKILNKKDLTLFEIDELVNKYRRTQYLKRHINDHPKIRKIFPHGLFTDEIDEISNDIIKKKRA